MGIEVETRRSKEGTFKMWSFTGRIVMTPEVIAFKLVRLFAQNLAAELELIKHCRKAVLLHWAYLHANRTAVSLGDDWIAPSCVDLCFDNAPVHCSRCRYRP